MMNLFFCSKDDPDTGMKDPDLHLEWTDLRIEIKVYGKVILISKRINNGHLILARPVKIMLIILGRTGLTQN